MSLLFICIFVIPLLIIFLPPLVIKTLKPNYKEYVSLDNIPDEFENIYKDLHNKYIDSLEPMRRQVRWRTISLYSAMALFLITYMFGRTFNNELIYIALICLLLIFITAFMNSKHKNRYVSTYKEKIIAKFIELINNKLTYNPTGSIPQEDYKKANFDNRPFNRYYPDDYIEGHLDNNVYLKMCDLHIQQHTR